MFRSLTNIKSSVISTLSSDTQDNDKSSSSSSELDNEKRKEIIRDFRRILGAGNEKYEDDVRYIICTYNK